jgi:murein DD-endopeptidase MepM/ murein hydrolase activator NlpD
VTDRTSAVTGPYTLPFFWPIYTLTQGYGCTGVVAEPPGHGCAHWHAGIDWDMPTGSWVASSNLGTLERWRQDVPDNQRDPITGGGNFVTIKHSSNRFTTYYHLKYNGITITAAKGTQISAGKPIAYSGNTGNSSGPHLHYGLDSAVGCATKRLRS